MSINHKVKGLWVKQINLIILRHLLNHKLIKSIYKNIQNIYIKKNLFLIVLNCKGSRGEFFFLTKN